jgi:hypothetical protein
MRVIAEVSSLHARLPLYNAQTVLELVRFQGAAREVALTGVSAQSWASGVWRDEGNPVWFALEDARTSVTAVGENWAWALTEQTQMLEFLGQFKQGRERLNAVSVAERELRATLEVAQDAFGVHSHWLEATRTYHTGVMRQLEEGPGTAHRAKRIALIVSRLAELPSDTVVVAPLDDVPALLEAGLELPTLDGFNPGEASRFRAIVDRAYRLEPEDDLDGLVHQLLELDAPANTAQARIALEARFAASGVYLSVGDLESARDLLEAVSQGQFERPSYLPGFVLVRLGQVRDLMGERPRAVGAYKAALALEYCPLEARQAAESGLLEPFTFAS